MRDDNWELISGDDAHEIEVLNYSSQVNVIEALVRFITHHAGSGTAPCNFHPDEWALSELHRTGTLFLLREPGAYRKASVYVGAGPVVIHQPPRHEDVAQHMTTTFAELTAMWHTATPVDVGAYLLWRINWVHPFLNGNGRTARAFCYACVCLRFGFVLPGTSTLIDLIMQNRDEYQASLKVADVTYEKVGTPDLTRMRAFVERLLIEQFQSTPLTSPEAQA